ncbi:hypothetical protein LTR37_006779 [Vermiconidia calcicola]|uniref:Uncharacterized protein n=1 Tax=Vermiconidia calcicola TaxID=1690605 RepID=A0ACC3NFI7_9PEZI|nr:hypothetical protein LTR37_006779 [Vermiconidia calcicola]
MSHPSTTAPELQEDNSSTSYEDLPESDNLAGFRAAQEERRQRIQRTADNLKTPLLALPMELRTMIYGFVITGTMKSFLLNGTLQPRSGLSSACRALRAEYRPFQETEQAMVMLRSIYHREYIDQRPWTRVRPFIRATVILFTLRRTHYDHLSSAWGEVDAMARPLPEEVAVRMDVFGALDPEYRRSHDSRLARGLEMLDL